MVHHPQPPPRKWMRSALGLLFLASLVGLMMRAKVLYGIPDLPFNNLLHAHSHTALLGFGFLFILGSYIFLILNSVATWTAYKRLWIVFIIAAIGMFFSFLYQSYGPVSISFSTLIMLIAYAFLYHFLRDYKNSDYRNPLVRWSIYWFFISTLGIWVLGPVSVTLGKAHDLYFLSIQFFLHFQFNGWFMYAIAGLLGYFVRSKGAHVEVTGTTLWLLNASLVLTFFLSVTYVDKHIIYFILTSAGVLIQLLAWYWVLKPILNSLLKITEFRRWTSLVLWIGIAFLILKVVLQGLVVFPSLAVVSYTIREFIVGYIHLILLGGMTLTGGGVLLGLGILPVNKWNQIGWTGLSIAFILMEVILFGHAIMTWQEIEDASTFIRAIFYVTLLFPVFVACMLFGLRRHMNLM